MNKDIKKINILAAVVYSYIQLLYSGDQYLVSRNICMWQFALLC